MKTLFLTRKGSPVLMAIFASFLMLFSACSKDNNNNNPQTYTTSGNASGSQQNPPVTTTGSASLVGNYNVNSNDWQYSVNWTSLSSAATVIEFHGPADVGVSGALLFSLTITAGGTNGAASATVNLTEQQEAWLLAGKIYYTIVNAAYITGEVRGQVYATAQ